MERLWPSAAVRAVFFDAVGTLIQPDPPALMVYAEVGRRFGSRLSADDLGPRFRNAFGREEQLDRDNGLRTSEPREFERWRRIVGAVLDDVADADACFRELFAHFGRPGAWRLDADAAAVLGELAGRGCRLGMASNYDGRLRGVVRGLPALAPLRHLVISSEVGWRKPAPRFFAALCQEVGVAPGQVVFVGDDWENDYEGGRAAGLRAVLFDPHSKRAVAEVNRIARLSELTALAVE